MRARPASINRLTGAVYRESVCNGEAVLASRIKEIYHQVARSWQLSAKCLYAISRVFKCTGERVPGISKKQV